MYYSNYLKKIDDSEELNDVSEELNDVSVEKPKTMYWESFWDKVNCELYTDIFILKNKNKGINYNRKSLSSFFERRISKH